MKEITAAEICRKASAHIEANGCLYDGWDSGDGSKYLSPCCCVVGTMRLVAGLPPTPGHHNAFETPALKEAAEALADQTRPERIALGRARHGTEDGELDIIEWSNHHADVEVVKRRGRHFQSDWRRLEHSDSDRGHIVRVLAHAAERCEA